MTNKDLRKLRTKKKNINFHLFFQSEMLEEVILKILDRSELKEYWKHFRVDFPKLKMIGNFNQNILSISHYKYKETKINLSFFKNKKTNRKNINLNVLKILNIRLNI